MNSQDPKPASFGWTPEPDVWWGADGIDVLLWADPPPYVDPLITEVAKAPSEPEVVR